MSLYTRSSNTVLPAPTITKIFNVMVWTEMDRVRMSQRFYTVSITGEQSAQPEALTYTIDGKPADMEAVGNIFSWAKDGGSVEKVAEEVAA